MKTITKYLIVVLMMSGCWSPQQGRTVWTIKREGSTCTYYTDNGPLSSGIVAPCDIYKVGDTLMLKKQ